MQPDMAAEMTADLLVRAETLVCGLRDAERLAFAPGKVFIGHGRSLLWMRLKEFLLERLGLECDEFNREPVPGITTAQRLSDMLSDAAFAFLVMTAEDEHADGSLHPRENVIHEAGLFQGRLGYRRAIVLLEDGCGKFSNNTGLTHIAFPKGNTDAAFEQIRRVLEREGIVTQPSK